MVADLPEKLLFVASAAGGSADAARPAVTTGRLLHVPPLKQYVKSRK